MGTLAPSTISVIEFTTRLQAYGFTHTDRATRHNPSMRAMIKTVLILGIKTSIANYLLARDTQT